MLNLRRVFGKGRVTNISKTVLVSLSPKRYCTEIGEDKHYHSAIMLQEEVKHHFLEMGYETVAQVSDITC